MGVGSLEYLQNWRMAVAKDELRRGGRSLAEIAYTVGFQSPSAFSTAVRKPVGYSPEIFRKSAERTDVRVARSKLAGVECLDHSGWTVLPAARSQARHMYQLATERQGCHFLARRSICAGVARRSGVTFCVGFSPRYVSAKPLRTP